MYSKALVKERKPSVTRKKRADKVSNIGFSISVFNFFFCQGFNQRE